jgi:predicted transcriptional regulator of viral defense system
MSSPESYLIKLQTRGRISFTTAEYAKELSLSAVAAKHSLRRLREKREIASPVRGLHVVLPPADRANGSRPPEEFVDYLMKHLAEPYYVALLSAAEIYGAAHNRPQAFQVMVARPRRTISCGNVRIQFLVKNGLSELPKEKHKVRTGYIAVSTPEITALDLVAYQKQAAGIDNIATVLSELIEKISADKLLVASKHFAVAAVQRLGFLLSQLGASEVADPLAQEIERRASRRAVLVPGKRLPREAVTDKRWRLIINDIVQPDI